MKKPVHATEATPLAVLVFPKGKKKASHQITGTDPAHMAQQVSKLVEEGEARQVRGSVHEALSALLDKRIPNATDVHQEIGGRRLRIKIDA